MAFVVENAQLDKPFRGTNLTESKSLRLQNVMLYRCRLHYVENTVVNNYTKYLASRAGSSPWKLVIATHSMLYAIRAHICCRLLHIKNFIEINMQIQIVEGGMF